MRAFPRIRCECAHMLAFPRMRCECAHFRACDANARICSHSRACDANARIFAHAMRMRAFRACYANARTCAHFSACDAMRCDANARMRCDANARIKGELMRVRYCNYLSMLGLKLHHVSKSDPKSHHNKITFNMALLTDKGWPQVRIFLHIVF